MFLGIHDCKIWGQTKNKVSEQCRIELAFLSIMMMIRNGLILKLLDLNQ